MPPRGRRESPIHTGPPDSNPPDSNPPGPHSGAAPVPHPAPAVSASAPSLTLPVAAQPMRAKAGSRPVIVAVLVLALLALGITGYGWHESWFGGTSPSQASAGGPITAARQPDQAQAREAGLQKLLTDRARTLQTRDRSGWLATLDPDVPNLAAQQAQLFDNLGPISLTTVSFDYAGPGPALPAATQRLLGPDAWVAKVVFSYRIAGADAGDVRHEQYLTLAPHGSRWLVAGTEDGPTSGVQHDLWDLAPVFTVRGTRSLVIGTSPDGLAEYAKLIDQAAPVVDGVWGTAWPRTVVVLVPSTQTQLAQLLGRSDERGLDQIAAVTTGELGRPAGAVADRVIINPATFAKLDESKLQKSVVLTHEVTHVATRASGPGTIPTWFSEGFADYVAYSPHHFTLHNVAGDTLGSVAAGAPPPPLPSAADFDPTQRASVESAYSDAFLAIDYISRTYSQAALIELYRAQAGAAGPDGKASTPVPLDQAVQSVLGVSLQQLQAGYQQFVQQAAANPTS